VPGRTPQEAFTNFVEPLASAMACVARCKLSASSGGRSEVDTVHHLLGNGGAPIPVGGPHRLSLQLRMKYRIVRVGDPDADDPFKIRTVAYSYTLTDASDQGILGYHWHPDGESHITGPHVHVGGTQLRDDAVLASKQHVPTGRISLEQVLRSLISEHDVPARANDWDQRLTLTDGVFKLYRTWQ
jgi:hypothetical protein